MLPKPYSDKQSEIRDECSPTASRVYPVLQLYADTDSPVTKTVAHLGISRRSVYRAIDELVAAGLVVKPTGYTFPEVAQCATEPMAQCAISGGTKPISAPSPPAETGLSTSTLLPLPLQQEKQAQEIVSRMVKLRHIHSRSYRKREFSLYPKARVQWEITARHLLITDLLELDEILTLMDWAFEQPKWPPKLKAVYHFRMNYDRILQEFREAQVADIS